MRILYLITGLGLGGAERQVCDLADAIAAKGNSVIIVSLLDSIELHPENVDIKVISLNIRSSVQGVIKALLDSRRLVVEWKPDLIHSHMFHANIFARIARLCVDIRYLICSAHSNNEGGMVRMWLYRVTNFLSDCDTNVSMGAVDEFVRKGAFSRGSQKVIYNGVRVEKFFYSDLSRNLMRQKLAVEDEVFLFLAVGRMVEDKDYPNLLSAFSLVLASVEKVKLVIVGDGPEREGIERIISERNLSEHVVLLGRRSDILELMSSADAFVLSSKNEGFGLVLVEAMAASRPVVATNSGGVAEVVGNCGIVVGSLSSNSLAAGMLRCIYMSPEERALLGDLGKLRACSMFSLEVILNHWLRLYEECKFEGKMQ